MSDSKGRTKNLVFWSSLATFFLVVSAGAGAIYLHYLDYAEKSRSLKTLAMVECLSKACQTYKEEFGEYPPSRADCDAGILYQYLGAPRNRRSPDGTEITATSIVKFPLDWLRGDPSLANAHRPVAFVDAWGRTIKYANPGRYNYRAVDIWTSESGSPDFQEPGNIGYGNWTKGLQPRESSPK